LKKQKSDLPQGTLDMLVLKSLSLGPMHGYGIGQRIQQLAEDLLQVEEGTLYRPCTESRNGDGSQVNGACLKTTGAPGSTH